MSCSITPDKADRLTFATNIALEHHLCLSLSHTVHHILVVLRCYEPCAEGRFKLASWSPGARMVGMVWRWTSLTAICVPESQSSSAPYFACVTLLCMWFGRPFQDVIIESWDMDENSKFEWGELAILIRESLSGI